MGALKWGLKATLCNLRAIIYKIVHFCGPFGPLSKGNFRRKMATIVGNRGQAPQAPIWLSPHLDFPNTGVLNFLQSIFAFFSV